jgi:hypothetical protein
VVDGHDTPCKIDVINEDCGVPHDEPVHSTPTPLPTAQHNVVDGHDMPYKIDVPGESCGVPHDEPVHSTVYPE